MEKAVPILQDIVLIGGGIQIGLLTLFMIALLLKRRPRAEGAEPVSIVIVARNEEANLKVLVPALLQQDHPSFEVVVVDDRSADGTYDYIIRESLNDSRVKPVHVEETPEHLDHKKYGLTLGIKAASHDRILLTDADCLPTSPQWIRHITGAFNKDRKQIVIGYSAYRKAPGLLNQFIQFETLLTGMQYLTSALMGIPYMGVGRNLAYRKSFFFRHKGFNGLLRMTGGDDDLFVNRHATATGTSVVIGAQSITRSIPKRTLRDWLDQKTRHLSVGKMYTVGSMLFPGLYVASLLALWLAGIGLLTISSNYLPVIYVLAGRSIWLMITCWTVGARLGDRSLGGLIPVLDILYVIYYLTMLPVALFTRKAKWKD